MNNSGLRSIREHCAEPSRSARWVAVVAAVLAIAGCSGPSDVPRLDASAATTAASSTTGAQALTTTTTAVPPASVVSSTSTTRAAVATTTSVSPATRSAENVLGDRVRAFFTARAEANAAPTPNPEFGPLGEAATGDALASVRDETAKRRDQGQAMRPATPSQAQIRVGAVSVTGASATVAACSIDDGVIFDVASGRVVNDAVVTHNYRITLQRDAEVWQVALVERMQRWEGVAGCARALGDFPY